MENKQCENCGNVFQYEMKAGFPRKYCPPCSAQKKASYEAKNKEFEEHMMKPTPHFAQGQPERNYISNTAPSQTAHTLPRREDSIVAQVFVKCANEQLVGYMKTLTVDELGDLNTKNFLKTVINELHEAYKYGLTLLEN